MKLSNRAHVQDQTRILVVTFQDTAKHMKNVR